MAVLSYAQLKAVWLQGAAGTQYATNAWSSLMAAIAEAESGGNTDALNPTDNGGTQTSWGLWQISLGNHDAPSPNWNNPVVNAQLAVGKLQSQGLDAWGTYTSGAYQAYENDATTPDGSGITGGSASEAAYVTSAQQSVSNCLWAIPSLSVPGQGIIGGLIGGFEGSAGSALSPGSGYCIFSRSEARALTGAALLGAGGILLLAGMGMLGALLGVRAAVPLVSAVSPARRIVSAVGAATTPGHL